MLCTLSLSVLRWCVCDEWWARAMSQPKTFMALRRLSINKSLEWILTYFRHYYIALSTHTHTHAENVGWKIIAGWDSLVHTEWALIGAHTHVVLENIVFLPHRSEPANLLITFFSGDAKLEKNLSEFWQYLQLPFNQTRLVAVEPWKEIKNRHKKFNKIFFFSIHFVSTPWIKIWNRREKKRLTPQESTIRVEALDNEDRRETKKTNSYFPNRCHIFHSSNNHHSNGRFFSFTFGLLHAFETLKCNIASSFYP